MLFEANVLNWGRACFLATVYGMRHGWDHTRSIIFFAFSLTKGTAMGGIASEAEILGLIETFSRELANDMLILDS
jgi:hypothetical protein